jgi:tRNA(Ile)-lysidine synthase
MSNRAKADVVEALQRSGALQPGESVLALLSGGADSVCLVHALHGLLGRERLQALHVHHGLRAAADDDARFCAELCRELGLQLHLERVQLGQSGNLEAQARDARYAAAEAVRGREGLDVIATGHTAGDQIETVLYRLVSSPGRRALLGMEERRGHLARPLLGVSGATTRAYCTAAGLSWREDESNADRELARNRLRLDVVPALRKVHPAADQNILATAAQLREEHEVLERAVDDVLRRAGAGGHPPAVEAARLAGEPPALRRLALRRLAESAAGGPVTVGAEAMAEVERLAARGGSGTAELGGGVRAVVEYGLVRFLRAPDEAPPEPATLPVPGHCRFGAWELHSERGSAIGPPGSLDEPLLDAARLQPTLTVRTWRDGDRIRPLGLGGSKSLQDVFGDRKVPRSLRRSLPVVLSGDEIAWVAGVAVSDDFKVGPETESTVRLRASAVGADH